MPTCLRHLPTKHTTRHVPDRRQPKSLATRTSAVLTLAFLSFSSVIALHYLTSRARASAPAKAYGFVYSDHAVHSDTIKIEAFFDPICPDSAGAWGPLKEALDYYGTRVWLVVHLFPLPYHDNSYAASRALHIADTLNASATFPLLELFFKEQEKFYNSKTSSMSKASVVDHIADFATRVLGERHRAAVLSGFRNIRTDLTTRLSFKYSASRGVCGAPFFFVNSILLSDTESPIDVSRWKNIIDPLISSRGGATEKHALYRQ
ncbi:hypothetical protein MLD38_000809 [Melastoma candidum]|uniref:Uncharacterized protein n=1 Tax=Melastoma candidum TaxID=119954 RepID=A0ACB9SAK5_9MYRT|nr:hypothetical protein MLD38_000809 [Melastoma candidum]